MRHLAEAAAIPTATQRTTGCGGGVREPWAHHPTSRPEDRKRATRIPGAVVGSRAMKVVELYTRANLRWVAYFAIGR